MRIDRLPSQYTFSAITKSICIGLATLIAGLSFSANPVQAQQAVLAEQIQLTKPTVQNRFVSRLVAQMMEQIHLSKLPLDDTISVRAFKQYIKSLDPTKMYFMQSDIDEFSSMKTSIDDLMKSGDYSVALTVFNRFMQRVDQRTELAVEMIDADHDFSVQEEMITDIDLLTFAKSDDEMRDKWRKRIKYSLLVMKTDDDEKKDDAETSDSPDSDEAEASKPKTKKPAENPKERLRKRYRSFARRMHQLDTEDVVERYITAITNSFDPHTSYMSKKTYENFIIMMGLELEGIGATLQGTDDGYTTIKNIVKGGAAFTQGGLLVEDKIYAVGQGDENGEKADSDLLAKHGTDFVDVTFMKLDDVVGMIRGKAGTVVRLSVMSENDSQLHTVSIVREKIKLEDQAARGEIFEQGTLPNGQPQKIGIIELPSFYADMTRNGGGRSTTVDVQRILKDFESKGVNGLILDLRKNGGGSLPEAINLTGLFIDIGPVVQVKNPLGTIEKLNDDQRGMAWDKPLVVLTSKFSASASEILAGAVQDYGRGLVVGDTTTHGKGTVQSLRNLSEILLRIRNAPIEHGALKITTAQFYRPNGDSTQKRGVLSDVVLPSFSDNMDGIAEADLDFPVKFDRVPQANFQALSLVNKNIVDSIQGKSSARLESSEDFIKLQDKIKKYVELKSLKSVSLNEEKFMARRKELSAEKEEERLIKEQIDGEDKIERKFYLDEVIKITADYMQLLKVSG
jgi:carboxyl-terminal processing protease